MRDDDRGLGGLLRVLRTMRRLDYPDRSMLAALCCDSFTNVSRNIALDTVVYVLSVVLYKRFLEYRLFRDVEECDVSGYVAYSALGAKISPFNYIRYILPLFCDIIRVTYQWRDEVLSVIYVSWRYTMRKPIARKIRDHRNFRP